MQTKTILGAAAVSLILSACGGKGGAAPVTPAPVVVEKQAPFLFTANNGNNDYQLWKTEGTAATTSMVKVINASGGADIENIIRIGKLSFFKADDGINGDQLWVSDGTEAGTIALATEPEDDMVEFNGQLFFSTGDPSDSDNEELWKSDGTVAGTVRVKDINPGANESQPSDFAVLSDTLYFRADDGTNGVELWKTDGTAAGTLIAADINTGATGSFPSDLIALGGKLLFSADNGTDGNELFSFNGTTASLVKNINSGSANSNPLSRAAILGSNLYFTAFTNNENVELWKTDGTDAGTALVSDIRSGSASSSPRSLTTVGNYVFFSADDGTNGTELWKTDGTTTAMVKDINAPAAVIARAVSTPSSSPESLVGIAGKAYFYAYDGTETELWVSDGTEAGTVVLKDINTSGSSDPLHLGYNQYVNQAVAAVNDIGVLFSAESAGKGRELWVSNGTAEGTVMVKDMNPDAGNGIAPVAR
jgi:ELWxxDGT repeat protein